MAENFQGQFSSKLSSDNYFYGFTSDDNDTEEPKKDEGVNDKNIVIVEERVTSSLSDTEFITLEELADSDFIRNRQLAARSIVENLHQAGSNKEALHSVISVMCKLSEDEDSVVRSELIEQLPSIALFCKEHSEDLGVVIRQQIVPYTVKLLTDIQRQIRKTGHSVLIVLLENNIIDHSQLSEWICPLIAQLVTSENIPEELKLEDVSVMCKMIPYVGKEVTEKFFLEPFLTVCHDSTSSTREVCMLNFGTISQVLGTEITEKVLLYAFLDLSKESWHVKVKCVDIAVDLAAAVSSRTRKEILSPVYISFLKNINRAVSHSAYLSLGRFISTFAEPSKSELKYKDGIWINVEDENDCVDDFLHSHQYQTGKIFDLLMSHIISKPDFLEECSFENLISTYDFFEISCTRPSSNFNNCKLQFETSDAYESSSYSSETFSDSVFISNFKNCVAIKNSSSKLSNLPNLRSVEPKFSAISSINIPAKEKHVSHQVHNENIFNNFQFWRMPLPEVDLAVDECKSSNLKTNLEEKFHSCSSSLPTKPKEPDILQDADDNKLSIEGRESPELKMKNLYVQFKKNSLKPVRDQQENILFFIEEPDKEVSLNEKHMTDTEKLVYDQDIVPPELLMEYISEVTMSNNEHEKNLTFYFPSVAYALGRKHWPCIRDLFNTMSSMLQYSVKKPLASFLHDLAIILGPEITTEDLLPVFLKMLRDRSVRYTSSIMQNISIFLKKTKPEARREFLVLIQELCSWDYDDHNWRYRLNVSEQLTLSVELFSSHEALCFLPASLLILQDKVSVVRRSGGELLAVIIKSIATNPQSSTFIKATLCALDEKCRKSKKWLLRQLYVFMCQDLAAKKSLSVEFYVEVVIPNLFSLAWDAVPNVRLAVARCITLTLLPLDFLPSIEKMHYPLLLQVLYSLQSDVDKDVRHFGQLCVAASGIIAATDIFKSDALSLDDKESASFVKENDKLLDNCL